MRKILFRGKRTDNKQWVEGFYALIGELNPSAYIITDNGNMIRVAHKSISEFTGLTDKNGTKIFEGDIVKLWGQSPYFVEFKNGGFDPFVVKGWECEVDAEQYEVIGNIHDNPELLEADNEQICSI